MKKKDNFWEKLKNFGKKSILTGTVALSSMSFAQANNHTENKDDNSKNDKTEIKAEIKTKAYALSENDIEKIVLYMVEQGENVLGNFELSDYKFSKEDLLMLQASELGNKIAKIADEKSAKKEPPKGKNYCLLGTRTIYEMAGIKLEAYESAYNAIAGFRKNENFLEIKCDRKDFIYLVNGTGLGWGAGNTVDYRRGHTAIVVAKQLPDGSLNMREISDIDRNLRPYDMPGKFGKPLAFGLKSTIAKAELVKKWIEQGRTKDNFLQTCLAKIDERNIYNISKDFALKVDPINIQNNLEDVRNKLMSARVSDKNEIAYNNSADSKVNNNVSNIKNRLSSRN